MFQELPTKLLLPRSLPGLVCARRVHLLHQIFSKIPHPHIKNLPFKPISDIELAPCRLTSSTPNERPSTAMLSDFLDRIQPLHYLQFKLPAGVETIRLDDATHYLYSIKQLQLPNRTPRQRNGRQKRRGLSKEIHLTTALHPLAFKHMLRTACAHVEEGKRVEFHLRSKSGGKALTVDWALRNLPYLRPDVILRSMPEGTVIIVPPMENTARQELIWAVSKRTEDQGDMRPEKRASITPKYTKAVEKSETLEPRQWQGWREYEEGTAPLFDRKNKPIKREHPPTPLFEKYEPIKRSEEPNLFTSLKSVKLKKRASVTPQSPRADKKSKKVGSHQWQGQGRRDNKDINPSDEARTRLFKSYNTAKQLKNPDQSTKT